MQEVLSAAIEMHRAGRLGPAARLYRHVLSRQQDNAEALHMLGVLQLQQGDHARAAELIARAVALRPNACIYHANLAEAYRAAGDFERAVGSSRAALEFWPDYPEALCNLGAALHGLGRSAEAVEPLRRAVELRPAFVVARNNLGIALGALDRHGEALAQFREAVARQPSFAPARTNLGQALLDRGELDEALAHCREAARLEPRVAAMHHNLGNVLRVLDRPAEARVAYLDAMSLDPAAPLTNAHLGLVLRREGEWADAELRLRKAVELEPSNASFWRWLAELYGEMDEPAEAIPCWERVLELDADRAGAHLALGWNLQEERRLSEARDHLLEAIRLQPASGQAHVSLGGLQEELGEMAEAEASFRTALRVQPGFAIPYARLATLLRGKLPDDDLAALEARLAGGDLAAGPRARLLFGLAHTLDARGEFERAAGCLAEANAIALELARGHKDYDPAEHERFVDVLIRVFDAAFFARLTDRGADSRRPIFIIGLPRSGTTLVEQVLASHSRIHGAGELRLARRSFEAIPGVLGRGGPPRDGVPHLDADAVRRLADQHLDRLAAIDGGRAGRVADKMPDNYMYLGFLSVLFPRACFIHCRRDLRDVAVSCWMTDFRSIRWANDPEHITTRFQQYRRLIDHWQDVLPAPIHHVDYEETVTDLETVARRLVSACGLDWEPSCLEFHRTERPVRTASVTQVRQPVYQRSVARWKNYESPLADLFAALPAANPSAAGPHPIVGRAAASVLDVRVPTEVARHA